MRRSLLATALAGLAVAAAATAPYAAAHPGHDHDQPTLLRDGEAGRMTAVPNGKQVQPDTTTEPSIAVNPNNPRNVVAGYQMGRVDAGGDASNGYATTFDGGKTWKYGTVPGLTRRNGGDFDRASDAVVAFGPKNTVYFSSLVFNDGSGESGDALRSSIVNNTSHDGGRTWGPPTVVIDDSGGGLNDKNWEVVDNGTGPGHHLGRLYVVWDRVAPVLASYSDDEGKTFSPPSLVYAGQGIGSIPLVLADGSLAVVFETDVAPLPALHTDPGEELAEPITGLSKLVIAVSRSAGLLPTGAVLPFLPPTTVGTYAGHEPRKQRASPGLPTAAVDPSSGRIYVGWDDARFRAEPSSPVNDPVVTWSDDDGVTWSGLKNLRTGKGDDYVNRFNSMLDVAPDGTLSVAYRQRQEAAAVDDMSPFVDTYYVRSRDGGTTFSKPLRVNRVRADARFAAFSRAGAFWGDYNQLAVARDGTAYIVRCESFRKSKREEAEFPPEVHHQSTWVAVVRG